MSCLRELLKDPDGPAEIIVVDNASRDDSVVIVRAALEELRPGSALTEASGGARLPRMLCLQENLGYAGGNNAGIRAAFANSACRAVWILNNDTLPQSGALLALCERLNAAPGTAMAGSTLVFADAPGIVQCAGGFVFCPWTGRTRPLCGGRELSWVQDRPVREIEAQLSYICGASLLIRRETVETLGLLPEEYFLYYEDTAYGLRAAKAGFGLSWAPESVVLHKEGGTTGASSGKARKPVRSEFIDYLSLRNRVYLVRTEAAWRLPVLLLSFLGVAAKRIRRGEWRRLPLIARAVAAGLAGRMGLPDAARR